MNYLGAERELIINKHQATGSRTTLGHFKEKVCLYSVFEGTGFVSEGVVRGRAQSPGGTYRDRPVSGGI